MSDANEIHAQMLSQISGEHDKSEGSFISDATKPVAIVISEAYEKINQVSSMLSLENLKSVELEKKIHELTGLERKRATKARGIVTVSGTPGSVFKKGDKVAADMIFYVALETKTLDGNGLANVLVECEREGVAGNVPALAVKFFPVTLPGLVNVTNTEPFQNGYEAETDQQLRNRYYERIKTPATSNNKHHFRNWAKEVTGVGDAKVFPLWAGNNTVKVVIVDSNMKPASKELVERVQKHIDPGAAGLGEGKSSLGSFCTVESAKERKIDIQFNVTGNVNKNEVEIKISKYFSEVAFQSKIISIARIGALLLETGIEDYKELRINGDVKNITLDDIEIPTLGAITIA